MKKSIIQPTIIALAIFMSNCIYTHAQFAESIKKKCKDLDFNSRVRIAVGSFKATTNSAQGKFSGELATMLSNALVSTECFQVLASKNSNAMVDIKEEAIEDVQMLEPQLLITGEVTEFSEESKGGGMLGVKLNNSKARLGFILQILNPTRQIIFSESINKETNSKSVGVTFLGLPMVESYKTKAMADAVEKAIIQAVELIVVQKDKMPNGGLTEVNKDKKSTIKIENIDFMKLTALTTLIKGFSTVKDATKSLNEGVGIINVIHTDDIGGLADILSKTAGYVITGVTNKQITLKAK